MTLLGRRGTGALSLTLNLVIPLPSASPVSHIRIKEFRALARFSGYDYIVHLQYAELIRIDTCATIVIFSSMSMDSVDLVQEKLNAITAQVQQLLLLLTACISSAQDATTAVHHLHEQMAEVRSTSDLAHKHLASLEGTLEVMRDTSATAADVDAAVRQMESTMLSVNDSSWRAVQRACNQLHRDLAKDIDTVFVSVGELSMRVEELSCELQRLEEEMQNGFKTLASQIAEETGLIGQIVQDGTATVLAVCFHFLGHLCV